MKIKILTMLLIISGTVQSQVIEEDKKYCYDVARIMFFEDGLVTSEINKNVNNMYSLVIYFELSILITSSAFLFPCLADFLYHLSACL